MPDCIYLIIKMSLQLNHHHNYQEEIYKSLKDKTQYSVGKTVQEIYNHDRLQSHLIHHYQNQLLRNAIDQRRLQFRNFVAEKLQNQTIDKEREYERAHIQLLGNLDKLQLQRLKLKDQNLYKAYQEPLPVAIPAIPAIRYEHDHSLQAVQKQNAYFDQIQENRKKINERILNRQLNTRQPMKDISIDTNGIQGDKNKQKLINATAQIPRQLLNTDYYKITNRAGPVHNMGQISKQSNKEFCQLIPGQQRHSIIINQLAEKIRKIKSYRNGRHQSQINGFSQQEQAKQQKLNNSADALRKDVKDVLPSKADLQYNAKLAEAIRSKWMCNFDHNLQENKNAKQNQNQRTRAQSLNRFAKQPNSHVQDPRNLGRLGVHQIQMQQGKSEKTAFEDMMSSVQTIEFGKKQQVSEKIGKKKELIKVEENIYLANRGQVSSLHSQQAIDNKISQQYQVRVRSPIKKGNKRKSLNHSQKNSPKQYGISLRQSQAKGSQQNSLKKRKSNVHPRKKRISNIEIGNIIDLASFSPAKQSNHSNLQKYVRYQSDSAGLREKETPTFIKSNNTSKTIENNSKVFEGQDWQRKIKRRLQLSQNIFIDSCYRNINHEILHLNNSYAKEEAERKQIRQKICQFVQDRNRRKRSRRNHSLIY